MAFSVGINAIVCLVLSLYLRFLPGDTKKKKGNEKLIFYLLRMKKEMRAFEDVSNRDIFHNGEGKKNTSCMRLLEKMEKKIEADEEVGVKMMLRELRTFIA